MRKENQEGLMRYILQAVTVACNNKLSGTEQRDLIVDLQEAFLYFEQHDQGVGMEEEIDDLFVAVDKKLRRIEGEGST